MRHLTEKHEESWVWRKHATFSTRQPCFSVWVNFSAKRCQKRGPFAKKHEKSSIWPNCGTFASKPPCLRRLGHLFRKKLQKVPDFARKYEKSSICPKCSTFWSRLLSFDVSVNFSEKNCKKCFIFRKTMKNRQFRHNLHRFRANHPVPVMGQLFWKKF